MFVGRLASFARSVRFVLDVPGIAALLGTKVQVLTSLLALLVTEGQVLTLRTCF
jgi:hypothetical protein